MSFMTSKAWKNDVGDGYTQVLPPDTPGESRRGERGVLEYRDMRGNPYWRVIEFVTPSRYIEGLALFSSKDAAVMEAEDPKQF